jgi:hypothetical protein
MTKIDIPYYFSHDSNARNDLKIKALRRKYKSAGYGNWWIVLEYLKEANEYKLKLDEITLSAFCEEFNVNIDELQIFLNDLVNVFQLLKSDGESIWSEGLIKRMSIRDERRKKLQEAGKKGAERKAALVEAEATLQPPFSNPEALKENKGKERKVNISMGENKPTLEEVKDYFCEFTGKLDPSVADKATDFYDHFESNGWLVGGKSKMKDWRAAGRRWIRNNEKFNKVVPIVTRQQVVV